MLSGDPLRPSERIGISWWSANPTTVAAAGRMWDIRGGKRVSNAGASILDVGSRSKVCRQHRYRDLGSRPCRTDHRSSDRGRSGGVHWRELVFHAQRSQRIALVDHSLPDAKR